METVQWGACVCYQSEDMIVHSVSDTKAALIALFDRWPVRTGYFRLRAMDACYGAQDGREKPEAARVAFLAAAIEAGALVDDAHELPADLPDDFSQQIDSASVPAVSVGA